MSGRIPNIPNRAQGRPFAGANPEDQAQNLHVNVGNEANQPHLAPLGEPAARRTGNSNSGARRPRSNRLQEVVAKHAELKREAIHAGRNFELERDRSKDLEQEDRARRLKEPINALIIALDALDNASSSKRQAIASDSQFAELLVLRASCRAITEREEGTLERWSKSEVRNFRSSTDPFRLRETTAERNAHISLANKVCRDALENLTDLRRALVLDPSKRSNLASLLKRYSEVANITKMTSTLMSTKRLAHQQASNLERLTGEAGGQLVRQSMLLDSALIPFLAYGIDLLSEDWAPQICLIAADIACVCLDLAACAMDITLPEPDANHSAQEIDEVRLSLDEMTRNCLGLADQMKHWHEDNLPSDQVSTSQTSRAGSYVSVLVSTGLHVPAQVQENGTARTLGPGAEVFGRRSPNDIEFQLIDEDDTDSDSDVGVDAATKQVNSRATRTLQ